MSECEYISFGGGVALHRPNEYGSKATASGSWWAEKPTPTIPTNKKEPIGSIFIGWGSRIRTYGCWSQSPMPYHLAIPHWFALCIVAKNFVFCKRLALRNCGLVQNFGVPIENNIILWYNMYVISLPIKIGQNCKCK